MIPAWRFYYKRFRGSASGRGRAGADIADHGAATVEADLDGIARLPGFVTITERWAGRGVGSFRPHAAATAFCHCAAASALKIRRVDREMRWR